MMPHVSLIVNEMRKFHNLVDASEILIYDQHKQLMAFYRRMKMKKLRRPIFRRFTSRRWLPIGLKDDWFVRIRTLEEIPQRPLLPIINTVYQQEIPENMMVRLLVKNGASFCHLRRPIRQHDELEGVGIIIAIRQEDVERYARLTQTRVNVFAEKLFSVDALSEVFFTFWQIYRSSPIAGYFSSRAITCHRIF